MDGDAQEARARLERDYLAGALSADEYMRLRRELHEGVSDAVPHTLPLDLRFASWGRRAAALLLDTVILIAVLTLSPVPAFLFGGLVTFLLLPILYHWLLVGARGQTFGKMAVGVRIVRAGDAAPVGYARALGRVVFWWILGAFFLLPLVVAYLWPLWDKRNQTLYDKMADTVVLKVR